MIIYMLWHPTLIPINNSLSCDYLFDRVLSKEDGSELYIRNTLNRTVSGALSSLDCRLTNVDWKIYDCLLTRQPP